MNARSKLPGQPLHVLSLILGCWVVLRVMTWQAPTWVAQLDDGGGVPLLAELPLAQGEYLAGVAPDAVRAGPVSMPDRAFAYWPGMPLEQPAVAGWYGAPGPLPAAIPVNLAVHYSAPADAAAPLLAAGHQLMWMASLARVTVPQELAAYVGRGLDGAAPAGAAGNQALGGQSVPAAMAPVAFSPGLAQGRTDRWSADAWMLARQEKAGIPASGLPRYGGSQAGAVLRYHLAPQSGHQPVAYLRATSALGSISENEAALGVAARPFARLPLMVGMEGRAYRANRQTSFRPAALAYTQLPPFDLPFGMTGDAYLQGGYVGGKYKTAFVDGHLRADRPLARIAGTELRLGGGIWGGAQRGSERLDIGPGATAAFDLAGVPSRLSMDYRFRVLGDAQPGSGPALTVAAGF